MLLNLKTDLDGRNCIGTSRKASKYILKNENSPRYKIRRGFLRPGKMVGELEIRCLYVWGKTQTKEENEPSKMLRTNR